MFEWKLTKNLTNPLDPEWDALANSALGSSAHPDRKMSFLLSREALKMGLKSFGFDPPIQGLKLSHFHQIISYPDLTISLSHTKECGVALIGARKDFHALGIDVEHEERQVKDHILERISNPHDVDSLRKIEIWCLKEACFKALMNSGNFSVPVEFNSIQLASDRWVHPPSNLEGEWRIERIKPFVVAMAFLKN